MTGKEYVLSVLEQVEKRNSNEKEFLDILYQHTGNSGRMQQPCHTRDRIVQTSTVTENPLCSCRTQRVFCHHSRLIDTMAAGGISICRASPSSGSSDRLSSIRLDR